MYPHPDHVMCHEISVDDTKVAANAAGDQTCDMARLEKLLAITYFAAMVIRYTAIMARHPDRRWLGGTIPIAFHCVLAAFIFMVGNFRLL